MDEIISSVSVMRSFVGGVGLIELQHGEFRIMAGGESFVAKIPVNFKNPLKAADQQTFEIKFRSNAQIELHIQGVMVGLERFGRCPAGNWLHHRRLDFHKVFAVQVISHQTNDFHALSEGLPWFPG